MTVNPPESQTNPRVRAKCVTPQIAYQLLRGERLVGLALALANGKWRPHSCGIAETVLSHDTFDTPQAVAAWGQRMGLGA